MDNPLLEVPPGSPAAIDYNEGRIGLADLAYLAGMRPKSWLRQCAEGLWWRVSFGWWLVRNWRGR